MPSAITIGSNAYCHVYAGDHVQNMAFVLHKKNN